jgi:tRNA modification GTPase
VGACDLCGRNPCRPAWPLTCRFATPTGGVIDHGLAMYFPGTPQLTPAKTCWSCRPTAARWCCSFCWRAAWRRRPPFTRKQGARLLANMRVALPGEFTERAFLNDKIDLAQAEAIADLIDASTEAAARSASRSLSGRFLSRSTRLRDAADHICACWSRPRWTSPKKRSTSCSQADAQGQLLTACSRRWRRHAGAMRPPGRVAARRHQGGDCRPAQCRVKARC